MAVVRLSNGAVSDDVLVIGLSYKEDKKSSLVIESGDLTLDTKSLLSTLADIGATGKSDEIIKLPSTSVRLLVFTGLGKTRKKYEHETLRRAAGAATQNLAGNPKVTISLPTPDLDSLNAVAEGAALGAYSFTAFRKTTKSDYKKPVDAITVLSMLASKKDAKSIAFRATVIAKYTDLIRDMVNTPPSHLNPISFVERIKKEAAQAGGVAAGLKVSVLDEKQLIAQGFGGITSVGQGSVNPPRLLHISYTPKKSSLAYAFVGKGITFDSGGLNLKPGPGMEAMKSDMGGAAAVSAAILAIASLKLPIGIETWVPLAENMISDNATRPGDIISIYGGTTVEVLNPDAEGRLVLADALVKAAEVGHNGKALDAIVDVATLTGAQVIALGTRTGAVMTNNEDLAAAFLQAAKSSGELFWPMPLPQELRASLDSPVADLANIGERMGGMLVAGLFLREFIAPELPWIHLDIAGPAFNEAKAFGYTPVGGTGVSMRSLVYLAEAASSRM
ncbi:MAG: leucyl aminopeptidase [Actinobacteria bacterium]|nr:leucyl aminopeptidase [Actinomycetota bacterium]